MPKRRRSPLLIRTGAVAVRDVDVVASRFIIRFGAFDRRLRLRCHPAAASAAAASSPQLNSRARLGFRRSPYRLRLRTCGTWPPARLIWTGAGKVKRVFLGA